MANVSRFTFAARLAAAGVCYLAVFHGGLRAEGMAGEVSTLDAYVVDKTWKEAVITATIKVKTPGTYYVVAGYVKDGKWLRGLFTRKEYYKHQEITLGAGDTIVVRLRPDVPVGPVYAVGIYKSLSDLKTYR